MANVAACLLNCWFCVVVCVCVRRLLEQGSYSDVTFMVHDEMFRTHRCVLSARCEYFAHMLETKWKDKTMIALKHPLVGAISHEIKKNKKKNTHAHEILYLNPRRHVTDPPSVIRRMEIQRFACESLSLPKNGVFLRTKRDQSLAAGNEDYTEISSV